MFCYCCSLFPLLPPHHPPSLPIGAQMSSSHHKHRYFDSSMTQHAVAIPVIRCPNWITQCFCQMKGLFMLNGLGWPWASLEVPWHDMACLAISCNARAAKASQIIPNWSKVIQIGQPAPIKMRVLPNSKKHSRSFKNIQDHSRILKMYQVLSSIIK